MPGKHYAKLGKTKLVRLPDGVAIWVKKVARELDIKENPEETMEMLLTILKKTR